MRLHTTWLDEKHRMTVAIPSACGRASKFGGPTDRHVGANETDFLGRFRLRDLKPSDYYVAMRWTRLPWQSTYNAESKRWWAARRFRLWTPDRNRAVVVWVADYGPGVRDDLGRFRRDYDISPAAMRDLGIKTNGILFAEFAPDNARPGRQTDSYIAARRLSK